MLKLASERSELRVVADQIGAPTWAKTIAAATSHIVAQALASDERDWWARRSGLYHFASAGATSWHGFAEAIFADAMGERAPKVVPIPSSDYPVPAKRPVNSRLSHDKLTEAFGLRLPDWADALKLCLSE
jgi:dTDP-4-dehydrorhamnose reductase